MAQFLRKDTIKVNLPLMDTINLIKKAIRGIEKKTSYELDAEKGKRCAVIIYEKFYLRTCSSLQVTITIDDLRGYTRVAIVAGGGGIGVFNWSWGSRKHSESLLNKALDPYIIK